MAVAPKKLPRLNITVPIVSSTGTPTPAFQQFWQQFADRIETRLGALELAALQDAVDTVNAAVVTVTAIAAGAAADATSIATANALQNSVVTGCTITALAATAQITISSHTRVYGDGTSVSVTGATISAALNGGVSGTILYDTGYYIYYDQSSRAGGAVTYHATDDPIDATYSATNPDRHYVGAVRTPVTLAAPDLTGLSIAPSNIDRV